MPGSGVSGEGQCRGVLSLLVVGVYAGLLLSGLVVGVYAGLLLSGLAVCLSRIFSLSLLATARGGASFLCPKRQRNEAKKALSNHATLRDGFKKAEQIA